MAEENKISLIVCYFDPLYPFMIQLYCIIGASRPEMQAERQAVFRYRIQSCGYRQGLCAPRHLQSDQDGRAEMVAFGRTDSHEFGLATSVSAKLFKFSWEAGPNLDFACSCRQPPLRYRLESTDAGEEHGHQAPGRRDLMAVA